MAPINNPWSAEPKLVLEDTEMHMPDEAWGIDQSSDVPAYHKRRTAGLWTAIASLAVMLAVAAAYGYSVLSKDNAQLAWLPGMARSISAVHGRLNGLEARLKAWQEGQDRLAARIQKLDTGWESRWNEARLYTAKLVNNAYQKQHQELDQRTAMLNAQIAQTSSRQLTEQIRIAQLEKELALTRMELTSVKENYSRELAALRERQSASQRQIASINNLLSTDEVDFEIEKNRGEEIVPGVSLHLTKTDAQHQRYQGWIWLAANRRTIWVRGQGVQRPVVFYPTTGGEAYELVITRVNQKQATGYLLVPRDSATQQAALASHNKSATSPDPSSF